MIFQRPLPSQTRRWQRGDWRFHGHGYGFCHGKGHQKQLLHPDISWRNFGIVGSSCHWSAVLRSLEIGCCRMDLLRQPRKEESTADRCGLVALCCTVLVVLWHVATHSASTHKCAEWRLRWTTWTHMHRWRLPECFLGRGRYCSAEGWIVCNVISQVWIFEWRCHMNRARLNTRQREGAHWYHPGLRQRHLELAVLAATHSQVGGHQGTMKTIPQKLQGLF